MIAERFAPALVLLLGACSLSPEPVEAVLDAQCRAALDAARAQPDDLDLQLVAARRLFEAAELRLQKGTLAAIDAHALTAVDDLLTADAEVDAATQEAILALASEGAAIAERVVVARDGDVAAHLYHGLHLSLVAWANGPARSLFAGFGPRIVASIERAVALDPTYDGGAPLRLEGRFRGQAPWPFGDAALALRSLQRSLAIAPVPVTYLFLGDLHWTRSEHALALEQWQQAAHAVPDESTRASAEIVQELARRRVNSCSVIR